MWSSRRCYNVKDQFRMSNKIKKHKKLNPKMGSAFERVMIFLGVTLKEECRITVVHIAGTVKLLGSPCKAGE